ncbi:MAG: PAS domain-containing sensor histidine kinase [Planctomycetota bacterium]|jgi:PAS domain S-box-containing protein
MTPTNELNGWGTTAQDWDEMPCYLSLHDREFHIKKGNRRFREDFGESVGKYCYEAYKGRDEVCPDCPVEATFANGESHASEQTLITQDGREVWSMVHTRPIQDENGNVVSVMEMHSDIGEVKRLQALHENRLVRSISHGIKGLLTGIDGGIYLVNSGFEKDQPDRVTKGWSMVQRNVERIRSMVLDVLHYAKDHELDISDIDTRTVVAEIRELFSKKAAELHVQLDFSADAKAGFFHGDMGAVRAMLVTLLENAINACRVNAGKSDHRVSLRVRRAAPWMIFEVEDNGIGMDSETREHIFSLSKEVKGAGLGLFISNKIVGRHGGTISVESEPGRGTRFVVRLPLEVQPSTEPPGQQ